MTTPEFDVSPVGRSIAPPAADLCIFPLFLFAGKRFTPVARPTGLGYVRRAGCRTLPPPPPFTPRWS